MAKNNKIGNFKDHPLIALKVLVQICHKAEFNLKGHILAELIYKWLYGGSFLGRGPFTEYLLGKVSLENSVIIIHGDLL